MLPGLCCNARLWSFQISALCSDTGRRGCVQQQQQIFVGDSHHSLSLRCTARALLRSIPSELGAITVVGHSLGGYLAMELLRQAPRGRIAGLGLISTQCRADTEIVVKRRKQLIAAVRERGPLHGLSSPNKLLGSNALPDRPQKAATSAELTGNHPPMWPVIQQMAMEVGTDGFERGCTAAMTRADSRSTLTALSRDIPVITSSSQSLVMNVTLTFVATGCANRWPGRCYNS